MRTDRLRDLTKLIAAYHNFAKAPNKIYCMPTQPTNYVCWDGKALDVYSEVTVGLDGTPTVLMFCVLLRCSSRQALHYSILHCIPWSIVLEKLTGSQLVKKFPALYGTRIFITAFTSAPKLPLSWARPIQSKSTPSHFLKIHLNIILPSTPGFSK
jgi:hypothetical protein